MLKNWVSKALDGLFGDLFEVIYLIKQENA